MVLNLTLVIKLKVNEREREGELTVGGVSVQDGDWLLVLSEIPETD